MKKENLRDGMIVELENGDMCIVIGDTLLDSEDNILLDSYTDDLLCENNNKLNIIAIYNGSELLSLSDRYSKTRLIKLWERESSIKWKDIKFGTIVRCWDNNKETVQVGRYLGYNPNSNPKYPFQVFISTEVPIFFKNCELV